MFSLKSMTKLEDLTVLRYCNNQHHQQQQEWHHDKPGASMLLKKLGIYQICSSSFYVVINVEKFDIPRLYLQRSLAASAASLSPSLPSASR
jgi:hypothetical protein